MRNLMLAVTVAATLAVPACYQTTFRTGLPLSSEVHTQQSNMFIAGLVGGQVDSPCTPAEIVTQETFLDMVLAAVTFEIYTPMTVTTTCAANAKMATR